VNINIILKGNTKTEFRKGHLKIKSKKFCALKFNLYFCKLFEGLNFTFMRELFDLVENYKKSDLPEFKAGDTIAVHVIIKEGNKERIQVFQGIVIQRRGSGATETVTVRKISAGEIGVERIFPIHSPTISKIEVIKRGKVRRARIFYLRKLKGKAARIKELMN
jgi:large subunit ribosomal protein L19